MVGFKKFRGVDLVSRLPSVVTFGVPFPFDKILECSGSSMMSVVNNTFHLVFLFSIDKVRWWPGEVGAVHSRLLIGR